MWVKRQHCYACCQIAGVWPVPISSAGTYRLAESTNAPARQPARSQAPAFARKHNEDDACTATKPDQGTRLGLADAAFPLGAGRRHHRAGDQRHRRRQCHGLALPLWLCGAGAAAVSHRLGAWWAGAGRVLAPSSMRHKASSTTSRERASPNTRVGHNPIGALSVFAMLGFLVLQVASGLLSDDEIAFSGPLTRFVSNATVSLATDYHANIGKWILLGLVLLHIGGHRVLPAAQTQPGGRHAARRQGTGGDSVPASRDDTASAHGGAAASGMLCAASRLLGIHAGGCRFLTQLIRLACALN